MPRIEEIIDRLQSSPLYYLFISSRELFHTNFWYWLSTLNKLETVKLFTKKTCKIENISFKREHNQTYKKYKSKVDLLISHDKTPVIVIENKVKDFPTVNQLSRIKNSFNDIKTIQYILVTLFYSCDIVFDKWEIITYENISKNISPSNFTDNEYHKMLIQDYKEFTFNLSELDTVLPITHRYDFAIAFKKELFEQLNSIKLWEGYQRLRASHLLYHFEQKYNICSRYSINNQKATIDFFVELKDDYKIGISLENNQFRKYVEGKKAEKFAQTLLSKQIFFNKNFKGRKNKTFLKYGTNYRYQYNKLENPISFEILFKRITQKIKKIADEKIDIESSIPNS